MAYWETVNAVRNAPATLVAPADALRITSPRGEFAYWQLSPSVIATEVRGFMTHDMARAIIESASPLFESQARVHGFHNWLHMVNYESACRVDLTAWVLKNRTKAFMHIGFTSRMVAMGVAVANMALGNILSVYADEKALTEALRKTLESER